MNDFATWWTGLSRGQQDLVVLGIVFVGSLLATRLGMYDADRRTVADGRPLRVSRRGRAVLLWGVPTVITLFLIWGFGGG